MNRKKIIEQNGWPILRYLEDLRQDIVSRNMSENHKEL